MITLIMVALAFGFAGAAFFMSFRDVADNKFPDVITTQPDLRK